MFSPNNPAACDDEDNYTPNPPAPEDCDTISDQGDKTRCVIKENYTNSSSRCDDNDKKPGFMCSGLVIRGTDSDLNRNYYSWDPSPTSVTSGGVSFSFLRKDSKFQKLAYGYVSGFIFYPELLTPDGKDNTIKVLCGYPLDAATDVRDNKGCGQYGDIIMSEPCIQQGIKTADQWYN